MSGEQLPLAVPEPAATFGISQAFGTIDTGWRTFPGHYLLYASQGAFQLEAAERHWLLPPQRAAWIAADTPIRISTRAPVTCSSVLFTRGSIAPPAAPCRVFTVSALAREMIAYAMRWGAGRAPADRAADAFFGALAGVCAELAADPDELWLPRARSPELDRAIAYALEHLDAAPELEQAARHAGVSARTLARRFREETELSWRQFVRRARMIQAMELLAEPGAQVIAVAYATGFSSLSAFIAAFRDFTGETPSHYRGRAAG